MKYSFVMPVYNNKFLLKNALESFNYLKNYNHVDYEVIIVDDGSDDNPFDYITGINKNYNMRYLLLERSEKSCRARTRNHGWKRCSWWK